MASISFTIVSSVYSDNQFSEFGLYPLSMKRAAPAVNNAKIMMIGSVGRFTLSQVPTGAKTIMVMLNGIATFQLIIFFRP